MNLARLSFSYIRQRRLTTVLNVVLLALGIGAIALLVLVGHALEDGLARDARGIDAVVGAKGSPLQLVLSSVYHLDAPTGNIPEAQAEAVRAHRAVRAAIPLALGDSWAGFRIAGTTPAYLDLYEAGPSEGTLWQAAGDVVVGAAVARAGSVGIGDTLVSAHGLAEAGQAHGEFPLRVVGVLPPVGGAPDRLVLTSVETVWALHGVHAEDGHHEDGPAAAADTAAAPAPPRLRLPGMPPPPGRDLTALLVQYSSPMAAALFPRWVNAETSLQAASPAFEVSRLMQLLGVGFDALRVFGWVLVAAAALSLFVALYNAMQARRYDLAMMRTLGAGPWTLFAHVVLEGLILAVLGTALGFALAHGTMAGLAQWAADTRGIGLEAWRWVDAEWGIVALALGVGVASSLVPALQAYRTPIAATLARG